MFQGTKALRLLNWRSFPVSAGKIRGVFLTHAHLDHCGLLPVLSKNGFDGKIHCSSPTRDLAEIILRDSAHLQEEDAERANRMGYTRHKPAKPLYTIQDVERLMRQFEIHHTDLWIAADHHLSFRLQNSGHILGSTFVEIKTGDHTIVFSGDLGRPEPLIEKSPAKIEFADTLVIESTYGDRFHPEKAAEEEVAEVVNNAFNRAGPLIIPSFAMERAQELLLLLERLREKRRIPDLPVYLDSPMGARVSDVMMRHKEWHKLTESECEKMSHNVNVVRDFSETRKIVQEKKRCIIIAGSGMVTGGRVLSYLEEHLKERAATVLLVGYQAEDTRGRQLVQGASEIKFFGRWHKVGAKIEKIASLSAHADQKEILSWLDGFEKPPANVFINHGSEEASNALALEIAKKPGWSCIVPGMNSKYKLNDAEYAAVRESDINE